MIKWAYLWMMLGVALALLLTISYFIVRIYSQQFTLLKCSIAILELILLSYATFNAAKIVLFFLLIFVAQSVVNCLHLKQLNSSLREVTERFTPSGRKFPEIFLVKFLRSYYREHGNVAQFYSRFNSRIFTNIISVSVLVNLMVNIYLLKHFFMDKQNVLVYVLVTVVQILATRLFISPLFYVENHLYISGNFFYKLQFKIKKKSFVHDKVKLLNFYELVQQEKRKKRLRMRMVGDNFNGSSILKVLYRFFGSTLVSGAHSITRLWEMLEG